jgi:hypothetical protein
MQLMLIEPELVQFQQIERTVRWLRKMEMK